VVNRTATSYYWTFSRVFGREFYRTWRQEVLASVLTAVVTFSLSYRNDPAAGTNLKIALLSAAIVLTAFALWHLVRTPLLVHRVVTEADETPHFGFGVLGIFVLVAIVIGAYQFSVYYWPGTQTKTTSKGEPVASPKTDTPSSPNNPPEEGPKGNTHKVSSIPPTHPPKERPSIFTNPVTPLPPITPSGSMGDVKQRDCSTVQNGGSGNIAAPCSNITLEKPEPRFHWTQAERTIEQGGDPAHPSVTIVLTLDGGNMTNAAFLALCDRPCKTVDGGAGASGAHQANYLSTANNKIVGLHINVPPVVLSTQEVWWHIISLDSEPIHVIEIERLPPEKLAKGF
jgi:hypothetical protein